MVSIGNYEIKKINSLTRLGTLFRCELIKKISIDFVWYSVDNVVHSYVIMMAQPNQMKTIL